MNAGQTGLMARLWRAGAAHPAICALLVLALSLGAAAGLPRLAVDAGTDRLASGSVSERQARQEVIREFGSDRRAFLYLREEGLWTPASLAALKRLHEELRQLPFVERIDDLFTASVIRSADGELSLEPLLAEAPAGETEAGQARLAALADPLAVRNLLSPDGLSLAIGLSLRESADAGDADRQLAQVADRARGQLPSLQILGSSRVEAEIERDIVRELAVVVPAALAAVALVLYGLCRDAVRVATAMLPALFASLWTFGAMAFLGMPLGPLAVLLPLLVLAFSSGRELHPGTGRGAAALVTTVALLAAFGGQAATGIPALRDTGLSLAFAILAHELARLLVLPLVDRLGAKFRDGRPVPESAPLVPFPVLGRRVVWGGAALALAAVVAATALTPALPVAAGPLTYLRGGDPLVEGAERLHREIAGENVFYITLDANGEGAFRDPANLRRLADIQAFLKKQGIFDRSLSLADLLARANREAAGGRAEAYEVPATRKLVGQYLVLHRPQDLEPFVSHDFRRANIVVRHHVQDAATLNRHLRETRSAVSHYAGPSMTTAVVGEGLAVDAAAGRLALPEALVAALMLACVLGLVALAFTSFRGGAIALVLAVLPALLLFALMHVLRLPWSLGILLALLVSVALAGHCVVRLFSRYTSLCRDAESYEAAAAEAVRREALPVAGSILASVAAFVPLLFSSLAPVAHFGLLACVAAPLAGLVSLLLAPAILSRVRLVGLDDLLSVSAQRGALQACPLFAGLSGYQIRKTILLSELRQYAAGDLLIRQGTRGRCMYVILDGQVEVVRGDGEGEQRLAVLGPGQVFGEIGFVHETYRTADVRALGPVSVLGFDHARLKKDLALFPHIMAKLNFNISGILGRRLAEVVEAGRRPETGQDSSTSSA